MMSVLIGLFLLVCVAAAFVGKQALEQDAPLMVSIPVKVMTKNNGI
ncbi:MAG: hypothetical protein QNJ51_19280 [Calothrix sp. MO_167.B12]|nr:hypothetical protein [Calothrix sp. MO_167.B12]